MLVHADLMDTQLHNVDLQGAELQEVDLAYDGATLWWKPSETSL